MFDFGDYLALQTSGIPWLIWIQLLITFLLTLLLYSLGVDLSDRKTVHVCTTSASPSNPPALSHKFIPLPKPRTYILLINTPRITQVGEGSQPNMEGESGRSRWRRRDMGGGEGMSERERQPWPIHAYFHPCHYFRLAREAFLKCLGLDSSSKINPRSIAEGNSDSE